MSGDHVMEALDPQECLGLLATHDIGRLCVLDRGVPAAYPVNYRLVPGRAGEVVIVVRTRADSVLDQPGHAVGFQLDGIDASAGSAWSVLARGTMHHADDPGVPEWLTSWDPHPWLGDRDAWLAVVVSSLSGRRLTASVVEWAFSIRGYL